MTKTKLYQIAGTACLLSAAILVAIVPYPGFSQSKEVVNSERGTSGPSDRARADLIDPTPRIGAILQRHVQLKSKNGHVVRTIRLISSEDAHEFFLAPHLAWIPASAKRGDLPNLIHDLQRQSGGIVAKFQLELGSDLGRDAAQEELLCSYGIQGRVSTLGIDSLEVIARDPRTGTEFGRSLRSSIRGTDLADVYISFASSDAWDSFIQAIRTNSVDFEVRYHSPSLLYIASARSEQSLENAAADSVRKFLSSRQHAADQPLSQEEVDQLRYVLKATMRIHVTADRPDLIDALLDRLSSAIISDLFSQRFQQPSARSQIGLESRADASRNTTERHTSAGVESGSTTGSEHSDGGSTTAGSSLIPGTKAGLESSNQDRNFTEHVNAASSSSEAMARTDGPAPGYYVLKNERLHNLDQTIRAHCSVELNLGPASGFLAATVSSDDAQLTVQSLLQSRKDNLYKANASRRALESVLGRRQEIAAELASLDRKAHDVLANVPERASCAVIDMFHEADRLMRPTHFQNHVSGWIKNLEDVGLPGFRHIWNEWKNAVDRPYGMSKEYDPKGRNREKCAESCKAEAEEAMTRAQSQAQAVDTAWQDLRKLESQRSKLQTEDQQLATTEYELRRTLGHEKAIWR